MMFDILVASGAAFGVALVVTPRVRTFATRFSIGDLPGERKINTRFVPRLGGAAIIAGFAAGLLTAALLTPDLRTDPLPLLTIGGSLLLIALLGVFDDVRGVGSLGKLLVQSVAAGLVILAGLRIDILTLPFAGPITLGWWGIPLTGLWLVGITNAVNLLDGLDGLACGVSAIVSATLLVIAAYYGDTVLVAAATALFFACLGFLRYNFHPASIFMGDTGSLFLGFLLATMSLRVLQHHSSEAGPLSLLIAVVTLGVPIVDTSVAFFRRLRKGLHPLKPDKEHVHHRLMDLGLTHRQTVVTIYAISMLNGVVAILLVLLDSFYATILLLLVLAASVLSIRRLGYIEEMRITRHEERPPIKPLSVARMIDRAVLVCTDLGAIVLAFLVSYWFRFHSGLLAGAGYVPLETYLVSPGLLVMAVFWIVLFYLGGLYEIPWDLSRVDYGMAILKTVGVGTLVLFLLTLDLSAISIEGRVTALVNGAVLAFLLLFLRMLVVSFERKHEILGFRRRNTIIVGASGRAAGLVAEIHRRPGLKYRIVGFVDAAPPAQSDLQGYPLLGTTGEIPELVRRHNVEEILVATPFSSREEILEIAARCNGMVSCVKVLPDDRNAMPGFRTEEILGHPLIRLYPTNLRTWQRALKRTADIVVSLLVVLPFLPLWLLIGALIRLDSRGPALLRQERVGKRGRSFVLYKFRSMVADAERDTGPVWAREGDERVTRIGRTLRRFRLDEVPQFLNVLKGEMSLVGPRPERPFFVEQLRKEVGFYMRRLLVRPGITGWAQVKLHYDTSLEDVRKKITYDLYYLENMSLTLDLKILVRTFFVALSGKGTR
jgi:exopolysaccharide biosynthesis polyprenyl glycosylphosphotransferase